MKACTERAEQKSVQFELDVIACLVEIGFLVSASSAKKKQRANLDSCVYGDHIY